MRTTVTLDPDTEAVVRERMAARGVSFKQALNDAIREGAAAAGPRSDFHTTVVSMGAPRVDLDHALRLSADLEDEELVRRMQVGT